MPDRAADPALTHIKEAMRRTLVVVLHTGRKSSDHIRTGRDDYDGSALQVTQKRTRASLWVLCRTDLKAELTERKRNATSVIILVNPAPERP